MDSCSVCLIPEIPDGQRCSTDCGHMYCKNCLDQWFDQGNRSCPLCRENIKYIQQGRTNYRVVLKEVRAQAPILNRDRYMYIQLKFYKCIQVTFISMIGLILFGLTTSYINHLDRTELIREHKICTQDLVNQERLTLEMHEINSDYTTVRVYMNNDAKWCSIPQYFLTLCGF